MTDSSRPAAPKMKRLGSCIIDGGLVFLFWYLLTAGDLEAVNALLAVLDPAAAGALDTFARALFQMLTKFLLKGLLCQTMYFCLVPAALGRGKTLGRLLFRLSLLDRDTRRELSPSRLVLREFVLRGLAETALVLPGVVSLGLAAFSADGRTLRDRGAGSMLFADTSYLDDER